jgi:hypothetical protein
LTARALRASILNLGSSGMGVEDFRPFITSLSGSNFFKDNALYHIVPC